MTDQNTQSSSEQSAAWQQNMIEQLLLQNLKEQRRARRWKMVWRIIYLLLFFMILVALIPDSDDWLNKSEPHTALVDINGEISSGSSTSAENVIKGLRKAYNDDNTRGIILRINSPGGSAVQSGEIYDEILRLRQVYPKIPVYSVVGDSCASGAYYIAAATDKIFANRASFVGSIGALIDSFGYTGLMEKIGVQRRLITAGKYKGFMDEFSPLSDDEAEHAKALVEQVRQQFVTAIKATRGDRIKDNGEVFTGLVWTGSQAVELGLIDGLADVQTVAKKLIGAEKTVNYTVERNVFDKFNAGFSSALVDKIFARNSFHAELKPY
jgi:protease-4